MAKALIAYWLVGCCLVGIGAGLSRVACPSDDITAVELAATVASWPAGLIGAIVAYRAGVRTEPRCKSGSVI